MVLAKSISQLIRSFSSSAPPLSIRNIGIIAHIDAGKTTTTERMLFHAGFTRRIGDVDRGDTVMDYLPEERERGITIIAAAITFPWKTISIDGKTVTTQINLIDTPGHVDFGIEVERSLRVMDGAIAVLDGSAGVEAQTLGVWRQANRYGVSRVIFVNKLDKVGASMTDTVKEIEQNLTKPLVCQWPVYDSNGKLLAIDDFVQDKRLHLHSDKGMATAEVPSNHGVRAQMLEQLAELDDEFLECYLDGRTDKPSIMSALQRVTWTNKASPVLCGSALRGLGVETLLDSIVAYLSPPKPAPAKDLMAFAFKVTFDTKRGLLVFVRVYSGTLNAKAAVWNASKKVFERIQKIYRVLADDLEEIECLGAGDIGVLSGMKSTATCDTLVTSKNLSTSLQSGIVIPPPVFTCAVTTSNRTDEEELVEHLRILQLEDPSIRIAKNEQTDQTLLSGMGELHLEIVQHRMLREWKSKAKFGSVQIAFQETLVDSIEKKQTIEEEVGGERASVNLRIRVEPIQECGEGFVREDVAVEHNAGTAELDEIVREMVSKCKGPLGSHPLRGVRLSIDITFPPVQNPSTNNLLVQTVLPRFISRMFRENEESFVLTQPVMFLHITTPLEHVGSITSDFHSARHGHINDLSSDEEGITEIVAEAPLQYLLGYASRIRGLSGGMATFHMSTKGYQHVPKPKIKPGVDSEEGLIVQEE